MTFSRSHRGPRPLSEVLSELFARRGFAQSQCDQQWQQTWAQLVGEEVARHSHVLGLKRGCLEILVDSSVLLHELSTFRKAELITALKGQMPEARLRNLRFRVGPVSP